MSRDLCRRDRLVLHRRNQPLSLFAHRSGGNAGAADDADIVVGAGVAIADADGLRATAATRTAQTAVATAARWPCWPDCSSQPTVVEARRPAPAESTRRRLLDNCWSL